MLSSVISILFFVLVAIVAVIPLIWNIRKTPPPVNTVSWKNFNDVGRFFVFLVCVTVLIGLTGYFLDSASRKLMQDGFSALKMENYELFGRIRDDSLTQVMRDSAYKKEAELEAYKYGQEITHVRDSVYDFFESKIQNYRYAGNKFLKNTNEKPFPLSIMDTSVRFSPSLSFLIDVDKVNENSNDSDNLNIYLGLNNGSQGRAINVKYTIREIVQIKPEYQTNGKYFPYEIQNVFHTTNEEIEPGRSQVNSLNVNLENEIFKFDTILFILKCNYTSVSNKEYNMEKLFCFVPGKNTFCEYRPQDNDLTAFLYRLGYNTEN